MIRPLNDLPLTTGDFMVLTAAALGAMWKDEKGLRARIAELEAALTEVFDETLFAEPDTKRIAQIAIAALGKRP